MTALAVMPSAAVLGVINSAYAGSDGNGNGNGETGIIDTQGKQADKAKPDKDKPQICKVKVQVKVMNAQNGTIYTVQLGQLLPQSKQASFNQSQIDEGDNDVGFMFQFKKGGDACPEKNATVLGNVNGVGFAAYINSLTKVNKVGVELS
jgi:hypothetical protein